MPRFTRSVVRTRHAYGPRPGTSPVDGLLVRSDPVGARLLGRALRALAEPASLLPRISAVWLWGDEIVVEVADPPDRLFPEQWQARRDERLWFLSRESVGAHQDEGRERDLDLDLDLSLAVGVSPFPHLVSVGRGDDLRLLLNLDAGTGLGVVTGSTAHRAALLEAIAAEQATTPWSGEVRVTCVGVAPGLDAEFPERVTVLPDIPSLIESLAVRVGQYAHSGSNSRPVLTGWAARPAHPATAGEVVLIGTEPTPAEARQLARLVARDRTTGPRVLVGTAHTGLPGAGYGIDIDRDGRVTAPLLGVVAGPQSAPAAEMRVRRPARVTPLPSWSAALVGPGRRTGTAGARWNVTVVLPGGAQQDVVLEADESTPIRVVAEQLVRLGPPRMAPGPLDLFTSEGEGLAPERTLGQTPLYDGCRVFLGSPTESSGAVGGRVPGLAPEDFARFRELYVSSAGGGALAFDRRAARAPGADGPVEPGAVLGDSLRRGLVPWRRRSPGGPGGTRPRFPDPQELSGEIFGSPSRLWERGPGHRDGLVLRVGATRTDPLTVDLPDMGPLGIAVGRDLGRRLAGWLVAQTALLHPPSALAVQVLTDESGQDFWRFARWLPPDGLMSRGALPVRVARDPAAHAGLLETAELIIRERLRGEPVAGEFWGRTDLVIVLDDLTALRATPSAEEMLRVGSGVGVHVICLAEDRARLPDWCETVVRSDSDGLSLAVPGPGRTVLARYFHPDDVSPHELDSLARLLAPLRDKLRRADRQPGRTAPGPPRPGPPDPREDRRPLGGHPAFPGGRAGRLGRSALRPRSAGRRPARPGDRDGRFRDGGTVLRLVGLPRRGEPSRRAEPVVRPPRRR